MPTYRQNEKSAALAKPMKLEFGRPPKQEGAVIQTAAGRPVMLGFTLDTSDSMNRLFDAAATGFNAFVDEQRQAGPGNLTFNCFSTEIYPVHSALELAAVPSIDRAFLAAKPGVTALLDGIGTVIRTLGARFDEIHDKPRVLVAILTDGSENASRQFSHADIFHAIHYRRSVHRWEFLFICASRTGEDYGLSLGIQKSNICRFETSPEGIKMLLDRLSKSVSAYRLGNRNFAGLLTDRIKGDEF